jgi:hypothetical protein
MRVCVRLTVFVILLCSLSSCDVDVFGLDSKRVAGGWRLLQTESGGFALMPPHQDVCGYVEQIGWQKPFIISRAESSRLWDVIDTATGKQHSISDEQRRSDPIYRDIAVFDASDAWSRLKHWRRQW